MNVVLGYITTPDVDCAMSIAQQLVSQKLVACANIIPSVTSVYEWNGQIQHDSEAILLVKTTAESQCAVAEAVCAVHPYECPAILFYPSSGGFPPYLDWVACQTIRAT
ncbi:divalent-cation tolerance protein CutA [Chrysiogenes arsenatis]|uniref:divalent-cation tolerance protein CutA n=1 Tax=Chrysiogenes arsenatis TaxID=309797 RepID=UPI000414BF60|nr:divalent-cation tolerance protein CutA [Chrysiogenes arsenatis]